MCIVFLIAASYVRVVRISYTGRVMIHVVTREWLESPGESCPSFYLVIYIRLCLRQNSYNGKIFLILCINRLSECLMCTWKVAPLRIQIFLLTHKFLLIFSNILILEKNCILIKLQ